MTPKSENVAIFNPLVLPLPNWHPDGPDGAIDGYVIPFVMPPAPGRSDPNRGAQLRVYPTDHGWRAALRNCFDHAETAEQARAFAAAWIRAAELLENVTAPQRVLLGEGQDVDQVVDAEVVDDDEDQDQRVDCAECEGNGANCSAHGGGLSRAIGKPPRLPGEPMSPLLAESDPPVALHSDDVRPFAIGDRVRVTDRMSEHHDRIGTVVDDDVVGDVGVGLDANRGRCAHLAAFRPAALRLIR